MSDQEDVFKKMGFANKVGFGNKPAILVVDLFKAGTDPESPIYFPRAPEVVKNARRLIDEARKKKIPIFYSTVKTRADLTDCSPFAVKFPAMKMFSEPKWREIDPGFEVKEEDYIIVKRMASTFFDTELRTILTWLGIDTVICCGYSTAGCVRASALDACQSGYRTIVVGPECCGDRTLEATKVALSELNLRYADVVNLEETIKYIRNL